VAYEVAAGGCAPRPLAPGEAARIFTGGPLPPGSDTVVRQEDTEAAGGRVAVRVAPRAGEHVRSAGEDVREGEQVLAPGTRLRAAHLGMLAALGRGVVAVRQRPRVAILSGGDELVEPDRSVAGGRIVASNSYSLAAQCREAGAEPVYLGIARDRPDEIERGLRAGLRCDVLLSSAGVSVGEHDHVRPVLEKLGCRLAFWGVRMKPGFPLAFGRFEAEGLPLVFGLPGNPVSAMVTFEQFVRPALLRMAGRTRVFRPVVEVRLAEALEKPAGRLHFVRVELARRGAELVATPTGNQSSGVLRSMTEGSGLLVFAAEATRLEAGARARVQVLDDEFFAGTEPGI
jgi:molybdopterin molybdotransferase